MPPIEEQLIEQLRKEAGFRALVEGGDPLVLGMLDKDEMMTLPIRVNLSIGEWVKVRKFIDTDKDNQGAKFDAAIGLLTSEGIAATWSCD
jgi:hypothetical protein